MTTPTPGIAARPPMASSSIEIPRTGEPRRLRSSTSHTSSRTPAAIGLEPSPRPGALAVASESCQSATLDSRARTTDAPGSRAVTQAAITSRLVPARQQAVAGHRRHGIGQGRLPWPRGGRGVELLRGEAGQRRRSAPCPHRTSCVEDTERLRDRRLRDRARVHLVEVDVVGAARRRSEPSTAQWMYSEDVGASGAPGESKTC